MQFCVREHDEQNIKILYNNGHDMDA